MGYTFKENCSDARNTKVKDIYRYFYKKNHIVHVYDPWIEHNLRDILIVKKLKKNHYDCIITAVGHDYFKKLGKKRILSYAKKKTYSMILKIFINEI